MAAWSGGVLGLGWGWGEWERDAPTTVWSETLQLRFLGLRAGPRARCLPGLGRGRMVCCFARRKRGVLCRSGSLGFTLGFRISPRWGEEIPCGSPLHPAVPHRSRLQARVSVLQRPPTETPLHGLGRVAARRSHNGLGRGRPSHVPGPRAKPSIIYHLPSTIGCSAMKKPLPWEGERLWER